jgi:GTP-binding protein EngB required for normal cell division
MLHLVDMPGYGYAQVSRKLKNKYFATLFLRVVNLTFRLNVLIEKYVKSRPYDTLKLVCVLIDCRRGILFSV